MSNPFDWLPLNKTYGLGKPPAQPKPETQARAHLFQDRNGNGFSLRYKDGFGRVWFVPCEYQADFSGKAKLTITGKWELFGGKKVKGQDATLRREVVFKHLRERLNALKRPASRKEVRESLSVSLVEGFKLAEITAQVSAGTLLALIEAGKVRDLVCLNPADKPVKRTYEFREGINRSWKNEEITDFIAPPA